MKVKPFYIKITDEMTPQMVQDAFDKCVAAGVSEGDCVEGATSKREYPDGYEFGVYKLFGVSSHGCTRFYNDYAWFGFDVQEITLDQLDEWLGIAGCSPKQTEWNGEGLPPVGVECEFSCEGFWGDSEYHWCRFLGLLTDKSYAVEFHHPTSPNRVTCGCFDPQCTSFKKPETPQQREDRERLEAAYDLWLTWCSGCDVDNSLSIDQFSTLGSCAGYLAIVDKTGYRKEK